VVATVLAAAATLTFAYYAIATALWLYSSRHGMSGRRLQEGIMLAIIALVLRTLVGKLTRLGEDVRIVVEFRGGPDCAICD
jgi:hypothetical protein